MYDNPTKTDKERGWAFEYGDEPGVLIARKLDSGEEIGRIYDDTLAGANSDAGGQKK